MTPPSAPLPPTLSGLLRLAVLDARRFRRVPGNRLEMLTWLERSGSGCVACLAGAVMHQTLGMVPEDECAMSPARQGRVDDVRVRLYAIDRMRSGGFEDAYSLLTLGRLSRLEEREAMPQTLKDCRIMVEANHWLSLRRSPFSVYWRAARMLAEAGL